MKTPKCPRCNTDPHVSPITLRVAIVPHGRYRRSSDRRTVHRFHCRVCGRTFSTATSDDCIYQKKRQMNREVAMQLVSAVSMRRSAKILLLNRKTIARKLDFLGLIADRDLCRIRHQDYRGDQTLSRVQFDEMESFETTKCKPLSIPLVVDPQTRRVLSFSVAKMPANGPLAAVSLRRYGRRADDRRHEMLKTLEVLFPHLGKNPEFTSDQKPQYPSWLRAAIPTPFTHKTYKGRRGCIVGQGELKRGGFDPLFALNHTAAMLRANISRLQRRTWCTTKRQDRLKSHIALYLAYHNNVLTAKVEPTQGKDRRRSWASHLFRDFRIAPKPTN